MSILVPQKRRGRPATGETPRIGVRIPPELGERVNLFALRHGINHSEALRRLTSIAIALLPHYDAIKSVAQAAIATDDGKMATEEHAEVAAALMELDDLIQQ